MAYQATMMYGENQMKQPLVDLRAQYETIKPEIDAAIQRVLNQTDFILGKDVEEFEAEFAKFIGVNYAVGVASGTDALVIALRCLGIGKGDEVVTTAMTFFASVESILRVGATPKFVDITKTGNMNTLDIMGVVTAKTKCILPVHLYGNPCPQIAVPNNMYVIEDAAQACGSTYCGRRIGSWGHIGCFSFFPGKNLGCYGDGGMLVTDSEDVYTIARSLRKHGARERYTHYVSGYNSRLDTIQAAVLSVKLRYLREWNHKRHEIAKVYDEGIKRLGYEPIPEYRDSYNVYNYYCFNAGKRRDELVSRLQAKGIGTAIYFPVPMHLQPALAHLGYKLGDFPKAEAWSRETMALPMYAELTEKQIQYILEALK